MVGNDSIQAHGLDFKVTSAGQYFVIATNSFGCSSPSNAIHVTVHPNPAVSISPEGVTSFCEGSSLVLNALTNEESSNYQWYLNNVALAGAESTTLNLYYSGIYTLSVSDSMGCSSTSFPVYILSESCA